MTNDSRVLHEVIREVGNRNEIIITCDNFVTNFPHLCNRVDACQNALPGT